MVGSGGAGFFDRRSADRDLVKLILPVWDKFLPQFCPARARSMGNLKDAKAKTIIVNKRYMAAGYPSLDNVLF